MTSLLIHVMSLSCSDKKHNWKKKKMAGLKVGGFADQISDLEEHIVMF